ncbi:MAG: NTP transferase domain-containing protein [Anaerolineae bacterium]
MIKKNIFAVILAAGASSRMGTSKMALKWASTTVLETTISNVKGASVSDILLVTGGYLDLIQNLPGVIETDQVHNPDYASGEMISSIKLALGYLQRSNGIPDAVLVLPGDMPLISSQLIDQVAADWLESPHKIVAPVFGKQRGHPVIFPYSLFAEFETLPADASPRDLIKANAHLLKLVPIDDHAVVVDVDTPAEYEKHRPESTPLD